MRKKFKVMLLLFLPFILSGCSVDYHLTITNNTMEENITATLQNTKSNLELYNRYMSIEQSAYYDIGSDTTYYYTKTGEKTDSSLKLNYKMKYIGNNLYKSNAISQCFYKKSVVVSDETILLDSGEGVTCVYRDGIKKIDEINVYIHSNLKMLETNADSKKDGIYYWKIDTENYQNKRIYLQLEKKIDTSINKKNNNIAIIVIVGLFVVGLIVFGVLKIIGKKNNSIK